MYKEKQRKEKKEKVEELMEFAEYLGVDIEDYLEYLHPELDYDDYSR